MDKSFFLASWFTSRWLLIHSMEIGRKVFMVEANDDPKPLMSRVFSSNDIHTKRPLACPPIDTYARGIPILGCWLGGSVGRWSVFVCTCFWQVKSGLQPPCTYFLIFLVKKQVSAFWFFSWNPDHLGRWMKAKIPTLRQRREDTGGRRGPVI